MTAEFKTDQTMDQTSSVTEEALRALAFIELGSQLTLVRSKNDERVGNFKVDHSGVVLVYTLEKISAWLGGRAEERGQVYVSNIKEIREGQRTDTFEKAFRGHKSPPAASCCFSLVFGEKNDTLDLVAADNETQQYWFRGLSHVLNKFLKAELTVKQQYYVKEVFHKADLNRDGCLSLDEVVQLLKKLNISMDVDHAKALFETADTCKTVKAEDGESCLDIVEFQHFVELVTNRSELQELFEKYISEKEINFLGETDLEQFFATEQKEMVSEYETKKMIEECESCPDVKDSSLLSCRGFYTLCGSIWMDIKQPKCRIVYQDMNQPLSHYFIDSSHNTYLTKGQLMGSSKVESYIHALKSGCRCVEIDVWNGEKCEPVVYHGHTLTSKILLKDVLNAINQYAFVSSEYPVIVCVENHLSIEQQKKMAEYFITIFITPARLLHPSVLRTAKCLPSPNELKNFIIIEGKKIQEPGFVTQRDQQDSAEDINENIEEDDDVTSTACMEPEQGLCREWSDLVVISQCDNFKNFQQTQQTKHDKSQAAGACMVEAESPPSIHAHKPWALSSALHTQTDRLGASFKDLLNLKESKATKLSQSEREAPQFVTHNSWQLTRIYPQGTRMGSSNYDPMTMWISGCQIAALNYQTGDESMFLNKGLFEDNGGCGYVLKPQFMRSEISSYNPYGPFNLQSRQQVRLTIVSGYQLPKKSGDKDTDILDPYVRVNIVGVPCDRQERKSDIIKNNGFHPVWNKLFVFDVHCPEMALILFQICENRRNGVVAQYCLPLSTIQQGYRTVHLKSVLGEPLRTASLLVHVAMTD